MTHTIEVRGSVPRAQPEVSDTKDCSHGDQFNLSMVCTPVFQKGVLVAIDFPLVEYFVVREVNPTSGNVHYSAVSRMVEDKDKYPNWPSAEPEAT